MIENRSPKARILGPAKEAYDKLPPRMCDTVEDWLEDRPNKVLYDKFDVLDAWLEYTGIIGYGEDFRELFDALK